MANVNITGSSLGTTLQSLLMSDEIQPGATASYELCKQLYLFHPLASKMVDSPLTIAMSQSRKISIPNSPEEQIKDAFEREWKKTKAGYHIFNAMRLKRIYGVSAIVCGVEGIPTTDAIPAEELASGKIYFNALDPLNTAGSLVLSQDPNAPDFQQSNGIVTASGQAYHRSRSIVVLNEAPIYLSFAGSAFGYVGRSIFQRPLFPLKSYINTMVTNDLVTTKAGALIAKIKQPGSIVDNLTAGFLKAKRDDLKTAQNGNVVNIGVDESIESLNLQNTDAAMNQARKNIIEDIASSANMPPQLLLSDGYASALANGTEDYKQTMLYISSLREEMQPLFDYFDRIVMRRAWSPEFYSTIQNQFPEYAKIGYTEAFYQWANDFHAEWPSLLSESESDKSDVEKVKLDAIVSIFSAIAPNLDPSNKASLIEWAASNVNSNKTMFSNPLDFDINELIDYQAKQEQQDAPGIAGQEG